MAQSRLFALCGVRESVLSKVKTSGLLIAVVGPSGAGKDSVIDWLKNHFAGNGSVLFARRTVTRMDGGTTEDHNCLTPEQFHQARLNGEFSVTWDAHGLSYGLPMEVLHHLDAGGVAIANGSRRALEDLRAVFNNILVVNLVVDRAILAKRLAERGRETAEEISKRLERMDVQIASHFNAVRVDNSGSLDIAGKRVADIVTEALQQHIQANSWRR